MSVYWGYPQFFPNLPFSDLRFLSLRPAVTLEDKSHCISTLKGAVKAPHKLGEFQLRFYGPGLEQPWAAAQIMSIGHYAGEICI